MKSANAIEKLVDMLYLIGDTIYCSGLCEKRSVQIFNPFMPVSTSAICAGYRNEREHNLHVTCGMPH